MVDNQITFMVYGDFTEPTMGKNFVIVRMPNGRVPWSKKIAPAINRLVQSFVSKIQGRPKTAEWYVDGESTPGMLRNTKTTIHYEWQPSQKELVKL